MSRLVRKIAGLVVMVFIATTIKAQQRPQYSQYMLNNFLLNPALAGIEDFADVKLSSRSQWVGIEGAPVTFYLSGHSKLGLGTKPGIINGSQEKLNDFSPSPGQYGNYRKRKPNHGLGGSVLHDRIGPFTRTEAQVSYAYHVWLNKDVKLAAGLSGGLVRQSFRAGRVTFADPADVRANNAAGNAPTGAAGLWLYGRNFYAGASVHGVFGKPFGSASDPEGGLSPHLFLTAAYKVDLGSEVAMVPSVLVKWLQPLPVSIDLSARVLYAQRLWAGLAYRQGDSFSGLAGFSINHRFELSYAFDLGTSAVSQASSGSHEMVLGVRLLNHQKLTSPHNLW